ncbi:MAG: hypothetical protein WA747_03195 [Steroidobacteraceae bacterium]
MRDTITPEETAEELRLLADYYEATMRAATLVRTGGASAATITLILAEHAKATATVKCIKEIRGIKD